MYMRTIIHTQSFKKAFKLPIKFCTITCILLINLSITAAHRNAVVPIPSRAFLGDQEDPLEQTVHDPFGPLLLSPTQLENTRFHEAYVTRICTLFYPSLSEFTSANIGDEEAIERWLTYKIPSSLQASIRNDLALATQQANVAAQMRLALQFHPQVTPTQKDLSYRPTDLCELSGKGICQREHTFCLRAHPPYLPYEILFDHIISAPHRDELVHQALTNLLRLELSQASPEQREGLIVCFGRKIPAQFIPRLRTYITNCIRRPSFSDTDKLTTLKHAISILYTRTQQDAVEIIKTLRIFDLCPETRPVPAFIKEALQQPVREYFQEIPDTLAPIELHLFLIRMLQVGIEPWTLCNTQTGDTVLHHIARTNLFTDPAIKTLNIHGMPQRSRESKQLLGKLLMPQRKAEFTYANKSGITPCRLAETKNHGEIVYNLFIRGLYTKQDILIPSISSEYTLRAVVWIAI